MKDKDLRRTKRLACESILFAIESIKHEITITCNPDENLTRAKAIKELAEAFNAIAES